MGDFGGTPSFPVIFETASKVKSGTGNHVLARPQRNQRGTLSYYCPTCKQTARTRDALMRKRCK